MELFSFRLKPETLGRLREECDNLNLKPHGRDVTVSDLIRLAIEKYINDGSEGNSGDR